MNRTDVNPWEWSKRAHFSQAVHVGGAEQLLFCAGQTATNEDGSPPTTSDMAEQVRHAFANLAAVLKGAGLAPSDVVHVTYYTTDVDELIGILASEAQAFFDDNLPASTLIGVARLAFPELRVEIEATAAR